MKVYISAKKRLKGRTTKKRPPVTREAPFSTVSICAVYSPWVSLMTRMNSPSISSPERMTNLWSLSIPPKGL